MPAIDIDQPQSITLTGDWAVFPSPATPFDWPERVPACAHLQPVLYPDNPYWGDHLRAINDHTWHYTRTFITPDAPFRRARLRFEGVDYYAEVAVNGQPVGKHEGGFVPFELDVTDALNPPGEDNTLIVRVSSPWDEPNPTGTYPTDHVIRGMVKGSYEHGEGLIPPNVNPIGIWRPVHLILDDGISVDQVRIRTQLDGRIDLRFTLTNATDSAWEGGLHLDIRADNHDAAATNDTLPLSLPPGRHEIDHTLQVDDPQLWWPWDHGEPHLYRLEACLSDSEGTMQASLDETFGIRTVTLERSPQAFVYRINERPIAIRGVSYMPGLYLSQVDERILRDDLDKVMQGHLNLVRVHVHVSPPELYDLCDRLGLLIWQDSELNWIHDPSPEFEARALALQREMMALLGNHPSIMTWCCHNEPTMVFTRRHNLEQHPDPALYADALEQDPTRPVFLCSGQLEDDWQRSGDAHTYYGALWSENFTDVYKLHMKLSSEFGFEAPAAAETLQRYDFVWQRQQHLAGRIKALWDYQANLVQFHVEHFRRLRAMGCAGYIHFWLVDLVPQVGCGVLDSERRSKGGYAALMRASLPLQVALEHDGRVPIALWVFNDTMQALPRCRLCWRVYNAHETLLAEGDAMVDVAANAAQNVLAVPWQVVPMDCARIELMLLDAAGNELAANHYNRPFEAKPRPKGYPWNFDFELGTKVFDKLGAPSLADATGNRLHKLLPRRLREAVAERVMRQQLPSNIVSFIARIIDGLG